MRNASQHGGTQSAGAGDRVIVIRSNEDDAFWLTSLVLLGVVPAGIAVFNGATFGIVLLSMTGLVPIVLFGLPLEMARARLTVLTVHANGRASFHQRYLVGPIDWHGEASAISDVRVQPMDNDAETSSLLGFRLCRRGELAVVCLSDAAAMDAARVLHSALGLPGEPEVVASGLVTPSLWSVKVALAKAVHIRQMPDPA